MTGGACDACGRVYSDPDLLHVLCPACRRPPACMDGPDGCAGPVEPRWPGYGSKSYPRCERHGEARLERERETRRRYGSWDDERPEPEPVDFDPADAGERWEA